MDLIKMEHENNEMDARNKVNIGQSIELLSKIEENMDHMSRMVLGKSRSVGMLQR